MSVPSEAHDSLRMPPEYGPHERTVICWPSRHSLYGDLMPEARAAHVEVACAIARFEPVTMIARPGRDATEATEATDRCGGAVEVVELPLDDSWFRDTGPIYVTGSGDGGFRVATDWVFNGWGGKFLPFDDDALLARRYADHVGDEVRSIPLVLEGGAISVDGEGSLVTTAQCLLHPNRNASLTRTEIEAALSRHLGVSVVHWLPFGLADDDDTDGHVDNVAAYVRPGVILLQGCDDPDFPDHERLTANRRWIEGAADARGRATEVIEIPVLPFAEISGERVPVPYLNLYVGNGFVLVPVCGHPADDEMCAIVAEQFSGREVVPLDVGAILAYGGGGIHCITQQIPVLSA